MRIDNKLNFVLEIEDERGTSYVHAEPIGRETFERYFLPISKTFAGIHGHGLNMIAGPKVASLMLKQVSVEGGWWDDWREGDKTVPGVKSGLLNEIRRLANVAVLADGKWTTIPLQEAVTKKLLSEDDQREVENALVFFTVFSSMHKRAVLGVILEGAAALWGGQTTLLNSTDFAASLPTSIATGSSGEKATPSSTPR